MGGHQLLILWILIVGLCSTSALTSDDPVTVPELVTLPAEKEQPMDVTLLHAEVSAMKSTLVGVTAELEKLQGLYMKSMDGKLVQLLTTIGGIDANVKTLQDRAHVWDIFKHHIDAWSDHMKSVDKKIDLIKRSQETVFTTDTKLNALELKTNHIFERVDMVNEKMHDMLKILYNQNLQKSTAICDSFDSRDTSSRLANIEKQITMIQNNHCKNQPRRGPKGGNDTQTLPQAQSMTSETFFGNSKEIKQLMTINKKSLNNLEYLSDTVTTLNTTTNQLQKSFTNCCNNNDLRVNALRDSVDSAFQKLERIYLNMEDSIKALQGNVSNNQKRSKEPKRTKIQLEDPEEEEDARESGSGSGDGEEEVRKELVKKTKKKSTIKKLTFRSNCHEIRGGVDGIYSFGFADDANDNGRMFNHRYCHFDRDGSAGWTVIQRRGAFGEPRQSFNRSWADYKHGFGELDEEFWYGNDFIHQLTNEEGQVGLRIELEDFKGRKGVVQYSRFYVSSERSFYRLDVQGFEGNVSDSFLYHNQMYFSTYDSANDHSGDIPCALSHGSGWWWNNCLESNLNGRYSEDPLNTHYTGIIWEQWLGDYSLKASTMMIRPVAPNGLWIDNDDDEGGDEVVDGPMSPPEDP